MVRIISTPPISSIPAGLFWVIPSEIRTILAVLISPFALSYKAGKFMRLIRDINFVLQVFKASR